MTTIESISLVIHIVCGYIALAAGAVIIFSKKGNRLHRILGRLFFYSMLGVSVTSIHLSIAREHPFLLSIAIFVFYQLFAGFRSVTARSLVPGPLDITVLVIAFINSLYMVSTLQPVLLVFGGISLLLTFLDLKIYYTLYRKKPLKSRTWLSRHIGMMTGAYIGTVTAFLVVNLGNVQPYWLLWLAPTVVLVPVMVYWQRNNC